KARQGLEDDIPHRKLAPAHEAHKDRIPVAIPFGHVTPRSTGWLRRAREGMVAQNDARPHRWGCKVEFYKTVLQWLWCDASLFTSVGRGKRPNRRHERGRPLDLRPRRGASTSEIHRIAGTAPQRPAQRALFAASRRRSLSAAQAAA